MVYVAEEFYKGVHVPIPSFSTLKFSGNLSLAPHRARLKISF
jgi:hypothetical protein